ncbi:ferredoxin [Rhodococcoides trifolii]|uniref:Ferredoxin n=1 Tax=Rhodococcoides trifolii TaxID=908250 RepID=A0A917G733_9NOCA|nr:PDR/VanB family oxidoreductase [Rhodococcus trifolii]GGG26456.1 ferredoxin [Rhodococcus trifolii]
MTDQLSTSHSSTATLEEDDREIRATVIERVVAADDVILLTLAASDGAPLPPWRPGAHIDIHLGNGLVRQYSLCGDPDDRTTFTIGVLNAPAGRGGSSYIHQSVHVGDEVTIAGPRNHFEIEPAGRYLFIAGGIGITPIAAMIGEAIRSGTPWALVYGGRTEQSMALREELVALGDSVTLWPQDTSGLIDLSRVLGSPEPGTAIYACGPEPLLGAIETICKATWNAGALHLERFTPKAIDDSADTAFELELAQSGRRITVPAGGTALAALAEAGVHILSSCGEGTCGTCETPVLEGVVDHRDSVLTTEEQDCNDCMMVCVSRAKGPLLVLDV